MKVAGILAAVVLSLVTLVPSRAEGERKYRVGLLFWHSSPNDEQAMKGVKDGLALAGIGIAPDFQNVESDTARAHRILTGWEREGYDLVFAFGTEAALRAKEATRHVPVVFTAVTNPFTRGIVDSWDGSGTNLCGNSNWIAPPDLLEVFQETVPGMARLGVVLSPTNKVSMEEVREVRIYFSRPENRDKTLKLMEEGVAKPGEIREAVRRVLDRGAQAIWIPIDIMVYQNLSEVSAVTMPRGIPLLASQGSAVEEDAVVGVAVDYHLLGMNAAVYAKRILLDGEEPGTLPIGKMHSFRTIVNLAAARRTRFTVPLPLLATADEILDEPYEAR
jgi:putative ABC transport system substrate-binding protein